MLRRPQVKHVGPKPIIPLTCELNFLSWIATWPLVHPRRVGDEWAKSARLAVGNVGKVRPFADEARCSTEAGCNYCVETLEQVTGGESGLWIARFLEDDRLLSGESAGRGTFRKRFRR
jgi:hypothetical protein